MNGSANKDPRGEPRGRSLAAFTVELDVYSGPYEGLLALILRDELEIFEVPLRELVASYKDAYDDDQEDKAAAPGPGGGAAGSATGTLERDTDFVDSATSLVLLKGRALAPAGGPVDEEADEGATTSPEDLEERLISYLKVRRGAQALKERLARNAGAHPTGHALQPRPGRLRINKRKLAEAMRRAVRRTAEPKTSHLGPITITVDELAAFIRAALARKKPLSFEDLVRDMDRLRSAVAFAAALALASEGRINLSQTEPFGPLTLEPKQ